MWAGQGCWREQQAQGCLQGPDEHVDLKNTADTVLVAFPEIRNKFLQQTHGHLVPGGGGDAAERRSEGAELGDAW